MLKVRLESSQKAVCEGCSVDISTSKVQFQEYENLV